MTEPRVFECVAYDETHWPRRWVVTSVDAGYLCETFALTEEDSEAWERAQNGDGPFPSPIVLKTLWASERFADIEDARKHLATDFDPFLSRAAYELFEHVEPARYSYDRMQSDALGRVLARTFPWWSGSQFEPTHVVNSLTAGDVIQLWSIVADIPANRFAVRVWNLSRPESDRLFSWAGDVDLLFSKAPTSPPKFDRAADAHGEFDDPESLRIFLAGSHPHLSMSANEVMHLLLPKAYPAVSEPPPPELNLFALTP